MSLTESAASGNERADDDQWIEQIGHEETIAPEAVNEEEVEEYIEVDGVVDDRDVQQTVLLREDNVGVRRTLCNGTDIFYAHVPMGNNVNLNLPDLLSRVITFTNGSKMYLCFSKKCRKQLAFEGHLYNIDGSIKPASWNFWRCANPTCKGAIRTSPNMTELRVRESHGGACAPDDIQIRLRITIYDLRLMVEFTDVPLEALYQAYLDKVMAEHNDIVDLFPPFEALKCNLEDHRENLTYRKRFALEATESDTSSLYLDSFGGSAAKFKKTKPFPPSLCMSCSAEFRSMAELPSQDQLLEHMFFDHNRRTSVVSRFTFEESGLFEQWVRELQYHSKYRLKKMGIHDEHMYYLCQNDDRHYKSNHGRSSLIDMHCTAFIRVHDWRLVIRREMTEVVVDCCLDHYLHSDLTDSLESCSSSDLFTPEVFMRDLAARREHTQQLIQDTGLQRIKRRAQPPSLTLNSQRSNCFTAAQFEVHKRPHSRGDNVEGTNEWTDNSDRVFGASKASQRQKAVQQIVHTSPPATESRSSKEYTPIHITRRENFADVETYKTVLQLEMTCDMLKERMQYARCIRTANHYLQRISGILDDVMADPVCAPSSTSAPLCENATSVRQIIPSSSTPLTTEASVQAQGLPFSSMKRQDKSETNQSLPLRQKVLVRKGENGQLVVVKRTILGKVRRIAHEGNSSVKNESSVAQMDPMKATTSTDAEKTVRNHASAACEDSGDGPPIGELLRGALYGSKSLCHKRQSLPDAERIDAATGRSTPYGDEDTRRTFRKLRDLTSQRSGEDAVAVRRPRGRPRKYP